MPIPANLRAEISRLESPQIIPQAILPFGVSQLDSRLPDGGLRYGAYHECFGTHGVHDDAAAILFAAGIMARISGPVLWCLPQQSMFYPALSQAGLAMDRVLFAETPSERTLLTCFEEGLRHPGIAGVVGEIGKISLTQSRRLQLAAEASGTIGIGLGSWHESRALSASCTSWRISMLANPSIPVSDIDRARWHVELLRCRSGETANFVVDACDDAGRMQ